VQSIVLGKEADYEGMSWDDQIQMAVEHLLAGEEGLCHAVLTLAQLLDQRGF
jgi:hypothetical protein